MAIRALCLLLSLTVAAVSLAPATAAPVVGSVDFFTDRWGPNTVPGFDTLTGNRTLWNLNVTTSGACSGVSVVVSRPGNSSFSLFLDSDPIFSNCNFSRSSVLFSEAGLLAFAGSTNAWSYTVTDATGSISGLFPLIADPELLPLVTSISVSDASTTPVVSWTLPDLTGFDIDRVRLRALDSVTGSQVVQVNLAADATSYELPEGFLQSGSSYYFRVILEDFAGSRVENRSNTFSDVAFQVPEPGSLALLSLGLAGVGFFARRRCV